jgi:AraC family ethanolamine operon transcriptional activator
MLRGFSRRALDESMLGRTVARHTQLGSGALEVSIERLRLDSAALRLASFSTAVRATVEPAPGIVTIGIALAAAEPFIVTGRRAEVGTLTVFGDEDATEVRYPGHSTSVTLAMPAARYAEEIGSSARLERLRVRGDIPMTRLGESTLARISDIVGAVYRFGNDPAGPAFDGRWKANAEAALVEAFCSTLADPLAVAGASRERLRSMRAVILAAEAMMDEDPTSIPSVPRLCRTLGISRRTLERAFHDMLGQSPAQYLRVRALNASREQLLQSRRVPGMVTRAAIDNGFWHMGRFAVAYRTLFGERPVDTLHRSGTA